MMIPGFAPSRPASQESSARIQCPFTNSNASSPKYHTFPCLSCAYQSKVVSEGYPSSSTESKTTVAWTPRIVLVLSVTATVSTTRSPSSCPR